MPRRRNAFNSKDDLHYCYQSEDIEKIGELLFRELITSENGAHHGVANHTILAPPLGSGEGMTKETFRKVRLALNAGKKVVGTYDVGDGQFLAYTLLHNDKIKRPDCYFKISSGEDCQDLSRMMSKAFQDSVFSACNVGKSSAFEQRDRSSSGLFALQNMITLACTNSKTLKSAAEGKSVISFYAPSQESYVSIIAKQRENFGQKFALSLLHQKTRAALWYEVAKRHKIEGALLKSAIFGGLREDLTALVEDVEILSDEDSAYGYHYAIRLKAWQKGDKDIHELLQGIRNHFLLKEEEPYYDDFFVYVSPEQINPEKLLDLSSAIDQNLDKTLALDFNAKITVVEDVLLALQPFTVDALTDALNLFSCITATVSSSKAVRTDFSSYSLEEIWRIVISEGRVELVKALLEAGGNPNMTICHAGKRVFLVKSLCTELLLIKIGEDEEKEERLKQILEELVDHGANLSALGKLRSKERIALAIQTRSAKMAEILVDRKLSDTKTEIDERLTSQNIRLEKFSQQLDIIEEKRWKMWHKEIVNTAKIRSCALAQAGESASSELMEKYEAVYGAFCKYLQSQIRITLNGIAAAASGEVKCGAAGNKLLQTLVKAVPYVGDLLKAQLEFFADKQQLLTLAEKARHFYSNEQEDEVLQDYCVRVTEFSQLEILEHMQTDQKLPGSLEVKCNINSETGPGEAVVTKVSPIAEVSAKKGVRGFFGIADDILFRKRIEPEIQKLWQKIAMEHVLKFIAYLRDMPVSYGDKLNLGEKIADAVIPLWFREEPKLEQSTGQFLLSNAVGLACMSKLAYATSSKIKWLAGKTGRGSPWRGKYELCEVIERDHLQTVVLGTSDTLIVSFRGTSNLHNCFDILRIAEARMQIQDKVIWLHRGFLKALDSQWNGGSSSDEKGLEDIITSFINAHPQGKMYLTGHSVGGSMASIAYLRIASLLGQKCARQKVEVYTFAQPKWCKAESIETAREIFGDNYHRIVREGDLVVTLPQEKLGYLHVGTEHEVSGEKLTQHQPRKDGLNKEIRVRGIALAKALPRAIVLSGMDWLSEVLTNPILRAHSMDEYEAKLLEFKRSGKVFHDIELLNSPTSEQNSVLQASTALLTEWKLLDRPINDVAVRDIVSQLSATVSLEHIEAKHLKTLLKYIRSESNLEVDKDEDQRTIEQIRECIERYEHRKTLQDFPHPISDQDDLARAILGQLNVVKNVLKNADPNIVIRLDHRATILRMSRDEEYPNRFWRWFNPLHLASLAGDRRMAELLLDAGADPNGKDVPYTPLFAAVMTRSADIVKLLLERGADPNVGLDGINALNASKGNIHIFELSPLFGNSKFLISEIEQMLLEHQQKDKHPQVSLQTPPFNQKCYLPRICRLVMLFELCAPGKLDLVFENMESVRNCPFTLKNKMANEYFKMLLLQKLGQEKCAYKVAHCIIKHGECQYFLDAHLLLIQLCLKAADLEGAKASLKELKDVTLSPQDALTVSNLQDEIDLIDYTKKQIDKVATYQQLEATLESALEKVASNSYTSFQEVIARFDVENAICRLLNLCTSLSDELGLKVVETSRSATFDYGYKLLDPEVLVPHTTLSKILSLGFHVRPENRKLAAKAARNDLDADHPVFDKINRCVSRLNYIQELLQGSAGENAKLVSEIVTLISTWKCYYIRFIDNVCYEYGLRYKEAYMKSGHSESAYFRKIARFFGRKKPLEKIDHVDGSLKRLTSVVFETNSSTSTCSQKQNDLDAGLYDVLTLAPPKSTETYGKHHIFSHNGVHYKYMPYAPGIEYVVNSLNKLLLEEISMPTRLVRLEGKSADNCGTVALYQASTTIRGANLHEVLATHKYLDLLDRASFSALFISSLLTGTGDAKPDNFIVRYDTNESTGELLCMKLIGVDNDISFCRGRLGFKKLAIGKGKLYSDVLNVLFFFPQMDMPVAEKVREILLTSKGKPEEIVSYWLRDLYEQNERYATLTSAGFTDDDIDTLKLPIKLPKGTGREVFERLKDICEYLAKHPTASHNSLFKLFYPGVSAYYETKRLGNDDGDAALAIKQLYIDAMDDEQLKAELASSDKLKSRHAWKTASSSKMLSAECYRSRFGESIEHLAEEFLDGVDFSRFQKGENTICRIIGDNLSFLRLFRLKNINTYQLELMFSHWFEKLKYDPSYASKTNGVRITLVGLGEEQSQVMNSSKIVDDIKRKLGMEVAFDDADVAIDGVYSESHVVETILPTLATLTEAPCKCLQEGLGLLLESYTSGIIKPIELARLSTTVRNAITEASSEVTAELTQDQTSGIVGQFSIAMLDYPGLSSIGAELARKGVFAKEFAARSKLFHQLLSHRSIAKYAEVIEEIVTASPDVLLDRNEDHLLPCDIIKALPSSNAQKFPLLRVMVNAAARTNNQESIFSDYLGDEQLIIGAARLGLHATEAELSYCRYDYHKLDQVTHENIFHKCARLGDQSWCEDKDAIFDLAIGTLKSRIDESEITDEKAKALIWQSKTEDKKTVWDLANHARNVNILCELYDNWGGKEREAKVGEEPVEGQIISLHNERGEHSLTIPDCPVRKISQYYHLVGWNLSIREAMEGEDPVVLTSIINKTNVRGNSLIYEMLKVEDSLYCHGIGETKAAAIKQVLSFGADPLLTERPDGLSPIGVAKRSGQEELAEILAMHTEDI